MTEKMWKFLFAIYGGGPIIKKQKKKSTYEPSQRIQSNSFEKSPMRNIGDLVEEYNLDIEE
jgi:hypothetical protein